MELLELLPWTGRSKRADFDTSRHARFDSNARMLNMDAGQYRTADQRPRDHDLDDEGVRDA
jgi:hypothetical protein